MNSIDKKGPIGPDDRDCFDEDYQCVSPEPDCVYDMPKEINCSDGFDNGVEDDDIDCADPDCEGVSPGPDWICEMPEMLCSESDNDDDGIDEQEVICDVKDQICKAQELCVPSEKEDEEEK